jgi:two-component system C4-dicarboxylate transport response regulator DctD
VDLAENSSDALCLYDLKQHDVVITDYRISPMDGFELFDHIQALNPQALCILMAAFLDRRTRFAVEVNGFFDVIPKPLNASALQRSLSVALGYRRGATKVLSPIALSNRMDDCIALLGSSCQIVKVRKELSQLISQKSPILIAGSEGIGRSYVAQFIHEHGPFAKSHYVECQCGELDAESFDAQLFDSNGQWGTLLEHARGGTLVFNSIETLSLELQRRLAAYFQAISDEMHVICLSCTNLEDQMSDGLIDDTLYFEVSLYQLVIPDLSERPQDVDAIVRYITENPERFDVPCHYSRESIDMMVADLRRTELTCNVIELIERIRQHAEDSPGIYV